MAPLLVPRCTKSIQIRQTQKVTLRNIYACLPEDIVFSQKNPDGAVAVNDF